MTSTPNPQAIRQAIEALTDIANMPQYDQDDAHRLRDKAKQALSILSVIATPPVSTSAEKCAREIVRVRLERQGVAHSFEDAVEAYAAIIQRHFNGQGEDSALLDWLDAHWHDWDKHITTDSDGWAYRFGNDAWHEANTLRQALRSAMSAQTQW